PSPVAVPPPPRATPLSLHDALPICAVAATVLQVVERDGLVGHAAEMGEHLHASLQDLKAKEVRGVGLMQAFQFEEPKAKPFQQRSEEHTSELQSRVDIVCRLLLEKK